MITEITSVQEIKSLLAEILLSKTNKISKISDESVFNAVLYGVAKLDQKALKDLALIESHLFPEYAYGENLDIVAQRQGIGERYGASQSSTFLRISAEPGTLYLKNTHTFKSSSGITFELEDDFEMGSFGYAYVKVRSSETGSKTNVDSLTISRVTPIPTGHQYVVNEYMAEGGRDVEQDDVFKIRIQESPNYVASGTLAKLQQVFMKINNNVLRLIYSGVENSGKTILSIVTQNGISLTSNEIDELLTRGEEYFSLTEQRLIGSQSYGLVLRNIDYYPIDLDFRVELFSNANPDEIRKNIQIAVSKYLDFRFWDYSKKVEWDNILQIVKTTSGVKYVLDSFFIPNSDLKIDKGYIPRLRGFVMRSLDGSLIQSLTGNLNPVYYANDVNTNFQSTVLSTI